MTERFFQDYLAGYRSYKSYWNYEDGCVLAGCRAMYGATGKRCYADFVLNYLEHRVMPDGSIPSYLVRQHCLDSFNCGKSLLFAAELSGEARFTRAAAWQAEQLAKHPCTKSGMPWHKEIYPEQVWIDGVYMTAPFFAEYAASTGNTRFYDDIRKWFAFLRENLCCPENGLYFHALDESRTQFWADKKTGLSPTHWLRGEGWMLMAICDTAAFLPDFQSDLRAELGDMLRKAMDALLRFRADDGLFYQVIDQPELAGNYTETSGSLMAAYVLMRGAVLRLLPEDMFGTGCDILRAVCREKLTETADGMVLGDICKAAGLGGIPPRDGSAAYYLSEPRVQNDPKGAGVLMLAEAASRAYAYKTSAP